VTAPGATPSAEAYGPQPPTMEDVWQARDALVLANEAGCDDAKYERLLLDKLQTEVALREAEDRAILQAAAEHSEPEPETELGHEYDGPELHPGTPEYKAEYAEYQAWAGQNGPKLEAEPEPELEAEP
jgi:hypothetical protein